MAMPFPPDFLDEIRNRVPVSDVVGRSVKLVRQGRELAGLSPFNKEKTPSFTVNDDKQFWHCFSSGRHGDVFSFLMETEGLSFPEAVEQLAGMAGLEVPRSTPAEVERARERKSLHALMEVAADVFAKALYQPAGREGLEYFHSRGLGDDVIARHRLGFAPSDGQALKQAAKAAGFNEDDLVEAGLMKRPDDGRAPYSFFRNRVMFTVTDGRERVVGFGGRKMAGDGPKYINSPETALFDKGRLLYGMARARKAALDGHRPVVVEGYMDVIAMVEAGFPGAVAPLGTAMTESQIEVLWKLAPAGNRTPVLCFDGDNAGRRAALRAMERVLPLLAADQSVAVAFLPEGEDPDSLIGRRGKAAMVEVLKAAHPLVDIVWQAETAGRRVTTPEEKAGLKSALEARIRQIAGRDVQAFYRDMLMDRFYQHYGRKPRDNARFVPGQSGGRAGGKWHAGRPAPNVQPRRPARDTGSRLVVRMQLCCLVLWPALVPDFLDEVAAGLGNDADLKALVAELSALEPDPHAPDAARAQLEAAGHGPLMAALLHEARSLGLAFARPDGTIDAARAFFEGEENLEGTGQLALARELARDADYLRRRLREGDDEATIERLVALKQQR